MECDLLFFGKMIIRNKTKEEIEKNISDIQSDFKMGIFGDDLCWVLNYSNYVDYLKKSKVLQKERRFFEREWVLVLRVCERKIPSYNKSRGRTATVFNCVLELWDYKQYLHIHDSFDYKKIKDLKILVQCGDGSYELKIPDLDKNNMLNYLVDGAPPIKFDCQSFVKKIKWMKFRWGLEKSSNMLDKWNVLQKTVSSLDPWDCVCLFDSFLNWNSFWSWFSHFAYYIWDWFFISKLWNCWPIVVATLQQMHDFYWTKEFVCVAPKLGVGNNKL